MNRWYSLQFSLSIWIEFFRKIYFVDIFRTSHSCGVNTGECKINQKITISNDSWLENVEERIVWNYLLAIVLACPRSCKFQSTENFRSYIIREILCWLRIGNFFRLYRYTKMCRIKYWIKRNQTKHFNELTLKRWILKYDVINDIIEEICEKNLKRSGKFGDMGIK